MRINCTKEEFNTMAVNCDRAECVNCVLLDICRVDDGRNFTEFVNSVSCCAPEERE